jgi:hypothetical protein
MQLLGELQEQVARTGDHASAGIWAEIAATAASIIAEQSDSFSASASLPDRAVDPSVRR